MSLSKNCEHCGKIFFKSIHISLKAWAGTRYCSKACVNAAPKSEETLRRLSESHIGNTHTQATRAKISKNNARYWKGKTLPEHVLKAREIGYREKCTGKNHYNWKGDSVGYQGIHHWIRKRYGKATKCEQCSQEKTMVHWANISGNYRRERSDWKQLCASCHRLFDRSSWEGHMRKGQEHGMAKLKNTDIPLIRGMLNDGVRQEDIARKFSICRTVISQIKNKKGWNTI